MVVESTAAPSRLEPATPAKQTTSLKLAEILMDVSLQPRVEMDPPTVTKYAAEIQAGSSSTSGP